MNIHPQPTGAQPDRPTEQPSAPKRRDIEGLRAIAILLVVGYHVGLPGFSGGYIGVDIFFVLSGYLITMLLINEATTTGRLDVIGFYARRARRLIPALAGMLVLTMIVSFVIFAPIEQRPLAKTAFFTAAYTSNIYFVREATNYFAESVQTNPYLHTWSLAVEEQFYLAWPLIVVVALGVWRRGRGGPQLRRLRLAMAWIALVSLGLSVWLTAEWQPWTFFLSPFRAWEFALGGLGVGLARRLRPGAAPLAAGWRLCAWLGLASVLGATALLDDRTSFPGLAALIPVLATLAMLCVGEADADSRFVRALSIKPLQALGALSYSWYLWHWPLLAFAWAFTDQPGLVARSGLALAALVIATLSYRWVENPIRHWRALLLRPRYTLALGAVITAVSIGATYGWYQLANRIALEPSQARFAAALDDQWIIDEKRCIALIYEVEPRVCSFGDENAATTVVLFGDSHAGHWFPTLDAVAQERGWRIVTFLKIACPSADIKDLFYGAIRRIYTECEPWRQASVAAIARLRPQAVVIANYAAYSITPAEWTAGTDRILGQLQAPGTTLIHLRDSPHAAANVPLCLARAAWRDWWLPNADGCAFEQKPALWEDVFQAQRQGLDKHPTVRSLDLTMDLCPRTPCQVERDGRIMYSDSHHLTTSFAITLAPALGKELDSILSQPGPSPKP